MGHTNVRNTIDGSEGRDDIPLPSVKDLREGRGTVPSEHHISAFHDGIQEVAGDVIPTRYPCAYRRL